MQALVEGTLSPAATADVERHLDSCDACRELLAEAARASFPEQEAIGRYRIERPLGAGGMGVVYAARDPKLDRRVALKLLRGDLPDARALVLREARAMARLSHPNVIAVHDAGEIGDRVFIAMELVEGGTLARWLAEKPRGRAAILDAFIQAARGLEAAHEAGIVHRDFKPQNALVGRDGRVRVADFGLALPAEHRGSRSGTPGFMAPEQQRGEAADARADVYSLCVALRDALAGVRVPLAIRRVLRRGLDPDPSRRFPGMGALRAALESARRTRWPLFAVPAALVAAALLALAIDRPDPIEARMGALMLRFGAERRAIDPTFKELLRRRIDEILRDQGLPAARARMREQLPAIRRQLAARGLPLELAFIPWAESRYLPQARSPIGAAGLWQFMPDTARSHGLRVDAEVDERLDVERSSRAAADYLAKLLAEFGPESFLLAIASYNLGESRMRRVLQDLAREPGGFKSRDFWNLYQRKLLPDETREYVPAVLAAALVFSEPKHAP